MGSMASVFDAARFTRLAAVLDAGPYVCEGFGRFCFDGIELVLR